MSVRFRIAGIPFVVHEAMLGLLVLLPIFVGVLRADLGLGLSVFAGVAGGVSALVLHEVAHALSARRVGLTVHAVTFRLVGGVTLTGTPRTPRDEFMISLAGPLANLVASAILFPAQDLFAIPLGALAERPLEATFLAHALLGAGNLLPAFPMDGGRLLRAALSPRLGARRATKLAVGLGRFLALGLVLAPFLLGLDGPFLALPLIGFLVLVIGEGELRRFAMKAEEERLLALLEERSGAGAAPSAMQRETATPEGLAAPAATPSGRTGIPTGAPVPTLPVMPEIAAVPAIPRVPEVPTAPERPAVPTIGEAMTLAERPTLPERTALPEMRGILEQAVPSALGATGGPPEGLADGRRPAHGSETANPDVVADGDLPGTPGHSPAE